MVRVGIPVFFCLLSTRFKFIFSVLLFYTSRYVSRYISFIPVFVFHYKYHMSFPEKKSKNGRIGPGLEGLCCLRDSIYRTCRAAPGSRVRILWEPRGVSSSLQLRHVTTCVLLVTLHLRAAPGAARARSHLGTLRPPHATRRPEATPQHFPGTTCAPRAPTRRSASVLLSPHPQWQTNSSLRTQAAARYKSARAATVVHRPISHRKR